MNISDKNILVIGICGRKGSGKDTLARAIRDHFQTTVILSFAQEVKERSAKALVYGGIENIFPNPKESPTIIRSVEEYLSLFDSREEITTESFTGPTKELFRPFIIALGQTFKKYFGQLYWVERWERRISNIQSSEGLCVILIPDVRFKVEYDWLKERGAKFIKVSSHSESDCTDPLETEHLDFEVDEEIFNPFNESFFDYVSDNLIPTIKDWAYRRSVGV